MTGGYLQYFDQMWPTMQDFLIAENLAWQNLQARGLDRASWGIVHQNAFIAPLIIPVSPTENAPNNFWNILEFPLVFDTQAGTVSVGQGSTSASNPQVVGGVAYDVQNRRIAITDDAAADITGNPGGNAPSFSGNIEVPLTLTGTTGGCNVNTSQFGTYYLWAEFLHYPDPTYADVARDASIHYPKLLDSFQLRLTGTPTAPSGDGVSIFLGKIVWAVAFPGTLTVSAGTASQTNGNLVSTVPSTITGEPNRVYSLIRDKQVAAEIDIVNERTQVYATGMMLTAHDHFNAVGSAAPTPTNPHGLTLADISGGGVTEPVAVTNQEWSLAQGIVDQTLTNNSPVIQTTTVQPSTNNATLTPSGLNAVTVTGSGINGAVQAAWVRIVAPVTEQAVFVGGTKLTYVYPTLRQTADHTSDPSITPSDPNSGDGWVGFSNQPGFVDPQGTYRLVGSLASNAGTSVLLLTKQLLDPSTLSLPALGLYEIDLGMVYWDGHELWRDYLRNDNTGPVVDQRSAGLVGPAQISTEAKADPNTGMVSRMVLQNLLGNTQFQFTGGAGVFPSWTVVPGAGFLTSANITQQTSGTDATLVTGGPSALTGVLLQPTANATSGTAHLYGNIWHQLKPNTYYGLSFWYKVQPAMPGGWNSRTRVGINANNTDGAGSTSVLTTGSGAGFPPDYLIIPDGQWHRGALVVQTNAGVTPANQYFFDFRLDAPDPLSFPGGVQAGSSMTVTNVQVQEGEWVSGYMGSQYVPSGASLLWDANETCPPGFVENTNAHLKFLVVADGATIPVGAFGGPDFNPASPAVGNTGAESNPHNHPSGGAVQALAGPGVNAWDNAQSSGNENTSHTHPIPGSQTPYYGLKLCKAV